jgi:hypothetical protein
VHGFHFGAGSSVMPNNATNYCFQIIEMLCRNERCISRDSKNKLPPQVLVIGFWTAGQFRLPMKNNIRTWRILLTRKTDAFYVKRTKNSIVLKVE